MLAIERLFELRSCNCEQAFVRGSSDEPRGKPGASPGESPERAPGKARSEIVTPPAYCLNHLPTTTRALAEAPTLGHFHKAPLHPNTGESRGQR